MIGFETYPNQGPGIFLTRLRQCLEKRGLFSDTDPQVWLQLSFKPLPDWIAQRRAQGRTRVLVRMDGCYCSRAYKIHKPLVIPVPPLDDWYSAKVNRKKNSKIRHNLLNADGIIFQSEFSRQLTQRFVCPTPPEHIIFNGIDLDAFSPEGQQSDIRQAGKFNILVSHSFQPYHRLHDSLKILAALLKEQPNGFHLHVLGGDEAQVFSHAKALAETLGLREGIDLTFQGKKPHDQLASVYRACDFMLNLSYWDTCPNVVIEALACGLPVVGVNHGGVAELVGNSGEILPGGILINEAIPFTWIDHQNIQKMPQAPIQPYVAAIFSLLPNLDTFSLQARETAVSRFDIETVCDAYIHAANRLLNDMARAAF